MPDVSDRELNQIVGKLVRAARIRAGLRQVDVAQAANLAQALVSQIESGRTTATVAKLLAIGAVLGVEIDAFVPPRRMSREEAIAYADAVLEIATRTQRSQN